MNEIIAVFSLSIEQLSEDALEAKHKDVRINRLHHTRKFSRVSSNTDLLRMLLLTSEPLISSAQRTVTVKKSKLIERSKSTLKNHRSFHRRVMN